MPNVFQGKRIWISRQVPSRRYYIDLVGENGGEVVSTERTADILVFDSSTRVQNPPSNSVTVSFLEDAVAKGTLADLSHHPVDRADAGPGPAKSTRVSFTAEDDRSLVEWVQAAVKKGAAIGGNEIYKEYSILYPRHTWQSWRARYAHHLSKKPPVLPRETSTCSRSPRVSASETPQSSHAIKFQPESNGNISPRRCYPSHLKPGNLVLSQNSTSPKFLDPQRRQSTAQASMGHPQSRPVTEAGDRASHHSLFTAADFNQLLESAPAISSSNRSSYRRIWADCADNDTSTASAQQWCEFYEKVVEPAYDYLASDVQRYEIYKTAWREWCAKDVENVKKPVFEWLSIYQNELLPSLDQSEESNGIKPSLGSPFQPKKSLPGRTLVDGSVESGGESSPKRTSRKRSRFALHRTHIPSKRPKVSNIHPETSPLARTVSPAIGKTIYPSSAPVYSLLEPPNVSEDDDDDVIGVTPKRPLNFADPRRVFSDTKQMNRTGLSEIELADSDPLANMPFSSPLKRAIPRSPDVVSNKTSLNRQYSKESSSSLANQQLHSELVRYTPSDGDVSVGSDTEDNAESVAELVEVDDDDPFAEMDTHLPQTLDALPSLSTSRPDHQDQTSRQDESSIPVISLEDAHEPSDSSLPLHTPGRSPLPHLKKAKKAHTSVSQVTDTAAANELSQEALMPRKREFVTKRSGTVELHQRSASSEKRVTSEASAHPIHVGKGPLKHQPGSTAAPFQESALAGLKRLTVSPSGLPSSVYFPSGEFDEDLDNCFPSINSPVPISQASPSPVIERVEVLMRTYGCTQEQAHQSIFATCANFTLDGQAVRELMKTGTLPDRSRHIWTVADDTDLMEVTEYAVILQSEHPPLGGRLPSEEEIIDQLWRPRRNGVYSFTLPPNFHEKRTRLDRKHGSEGAGGCVGRLEFLRMFENGKRGKN